MKTTFLPVLAVFAVSAALAAILFTGCSKEKTPQEGPVAVSFTSRVDKLQANGSKAADQQWAIGDSIGIYMIKSGETLSDASIAAGAANRQYQATATTTDAAFEPYSADQTIYYPSGPVQPVDFIAYYPYTSQITGYTYPVDLSDQSDQAAIDLMYSYNATGKDWTSPAASLVFQHRLAKVVLTIKRGTGMAYEDLSKMTVVLKSACTEGTLNLVDGRDLFLEPTLNDVTFRTAGAGSKYEAILMPISHRDYIVEFRLNNAKNEVFTWTITGSDGDFAASTKYEFEITMNRTGVDATGTILPWNEGPGGLTGIAD